MKGHARVGIACCSACLFHSAAGVEASRPSHQTAADGVYVPSASVQTETDEYTRYDLKDPETASFKITYEVTAATPGARFYYNPIRKGSTASDESA